MSVMLSEKMEQEPVQNIDGYEDWVLTDVDAEDNYVISRYEVRIKGRKPLVLVEPSISKIITNVRQYLSCKESVAREILYKSVIETAEPLSIEEHFKLLRYLEKNT